MRCLLGILFILAESDVLMKPFEDKSEGRKVEQHWRPSDGFTRRTGPGIKSEMK